MTIREYRPEDFDRVLAVMCDAFKADRLYEYFIEDPAQRQKFLNIFMQFRLKFGVKKGTVFVTDDVEGAIILIKPGQSMSVADLIRYGGMKAMLSCSNAQRKRIMAFNTFADAQAAQHMKQPYWHISPLCVSSQKQGQGYGSALLDHGLHYIASGPYSCYLETQDPQNIPFYQTHGFRTLSDVPVPDSDLSNHSMVYTAK